MQAAVLDFGDIYPWMIIYNLLDASRAYLTKLSFINDFRSEGLGTLPALRACRWKRLTHRRRKSRRRERAVPSYTASVYGLADELAGHLHLDRTLELVLTAPSKVKTCYFYRSVGDTS
jgi:hypothetical protein